VSLIGVPSFLQPFSPVLDEVKVAVHRGDAVDCLLEHVLNTFTITL
jgi:hypothetical protein